jgi:hypothetical protein
MIRHSNHYHRHSSGVEENEEAIQEHISLVPKEDGSRGDQQPVLGLRRSPFHTLRCGSSSCSMKKGLLYGVGIGTMMIWLFSFNREHAMTMYENITNFKEANTAAMLPDVSRNVVPRITDPPIFRDGTETLPPLFIGNTTETKSKGDKKTDKTTSQDATPAVTIVLSIKHGLFRKSSALCDLVVQSFVQRLVVLPSGSQDSSPWNVLDLQSKLKARGMLEKLTVKESQGSKNYNLRFTPFEDILTEAVFNVEDDIIISPQALKDALMIWQTNKQRLVGFVPQLFQKNVEGRLVFRSNIQEYDNTYNALGMQAGMVHHRK